jgi:hypothetical protein
MWTWFSARCRAGAIALTAFVAVAACSPQDEADASRLRPSTLTEAEWRVDAIPQEQPGLARRVWKTANNTTRDVLGNLSASLEEGRGGPLTLAFATGVTLHLEQLSMHDADARIGPEGEDSFQTLLGLPDQVEARVYRVLNENIARSARAGGPCGEIRSTYVALAEFVDEDGDWVLRMAAFKGAVAPAGGEEEGDPGLCGPYAYQQPE